MRFLFSLIVVAIVCGTSIGCKMSAPMHVWKSARVMPDQRGLIAVGPIGIASRATLSRQEDLSPLHEAAEQLQTAMRATQFDYQYAANALHPSELEQASQIQLVSFDNQPNDSATLGAARRAGAKYVLQGNVVAAKLEQTPPKQKWGLKEMIFGQKKVPEYLTVHWAVIDTESGLRVREETVSLTRAEVEKKYPELQTNVPGAHGRILAAASRSGWELVSPATQRTDAVLELPWIWMGSSQVRKGNGLARQGRWDLAEREWQEVADRHPTNKAAWHNLSLAAVAKEDFELARNRIRHADTYWPGDSTFKTQVWIERLQREYHAAMNLPPRNEGWTFPDATFMNRP